MLRLIARRVLLMLLTAVAVSALLFFAVTRLLGSPAEMMLGQDASPSAIAALNAAYGFDQPAMIQYLRWLGGALTGDLGRSYTTQQSVAAEIAARVPVTLELSLWSIALAVTAAVVCNTIPVARGTLQPMVTAANLIGITVPNFMLGVSLIFLFSVKLNLLPSTGWAPWTDGVGVHLTHMIMPVPVSYTHLRRLADSDRGQPFMGHLAAATATSLGNTVTNLPPRYWMRTGSAVSF